MTPEGYEPTTDPQAGDFVMIGDSLCEIRMDSGAPYVQDFGRLLQEFTAKGCKTYRTITPRVHIEVMRVSKDHPTAKRLLTIHVPGWVNDKIVEVTIRELDVPRCTVCGGQAPEGRTICGGGCYEALRKYGDQAIKYPVKP